MRIEHVAPADDGTATIRIEGLARSLAILHLTDSHMAEGDARDPQTEAYLTRTRELFEQRTPGGVSARQVFQETLAAAARRGVDGVVLTGDIVHFPSHAGLDIVRQGLGGVGAPFLYTLGNHDWHFPHLPWCEETRREHYPRFHDLTGGAPACQSLELGGVRLIALDNSTYQVGAQQVAFLRQELATGQPCLLFIHIPLWAETLAPAVIERWQAPIVMAAVHGWTAETRAQWKVAETSASTRACFELLTGSESDNLAGIFCGHVHFAHVHTYRDGRYQYVTAPGFAGGRRFIRLEAT